MKALIVSDLHLKPSNWSVSKRTLALIEQKVEELKPDVLINLGDTFHTKNHVHASVQNLYFKFVERMAQKVPIIQLIGNHDWGVEYSDHPFYGLKNIPNVTVVDESLVLGENVFIAYCRETERFQKFLEAAGPRITRIFAHMDLNGYTPGSTWTEVSPFFDAEFFTRYEQVISGHLHLAQNKTLPSGTEIIFVGSAYTTDFGESDQEKRFLLLDLETGAWESIPTNMTYHRTFQMKAGDPFPEIDAEQLKAGVEFRVIFTGTREQYTGLSIPKDYPAKVLPDFVSSAGARIELNASDNQDQTMKKYIEAELKRSFGGIEQSGLDVEKLIKIGKRFIPN